MKKLFILFSLLSLWFCAGFYSDNGLSQISSKRFKASFNMKNGMFDGSYVSYYLNGIKRAEGKFQSNQRIGKWSVWDSTGKLMTKRNYKNDFDFEEIFPGTSSPKTKRLPVLIRNEAGFFPYYEINQREILYSKRIWRFIPFAENNPIFKDDILFNALADSVMSGKITAYSPENDEFQIKIGRENVDRFTDTLRTKILGYKIKEDFFFDSKRKISEKRIIGICPVMQNVFDTSKSTDVCWFYFPQIRNLLNAISIDPSKYSPDIKTLDDLFFFHTFASTIYKETNLRNLELKEHMPDGSLQIDVELIEAEHDLWLNYSK